MKCKIIVIILIVELFISMGIIVSAYDGKEILNGYIIYVDAGHGGNDNGAYNNDVFEDSINLNISKLLVKDLLDKGAYVYTSRDGDYDLANVYDKNRKNKDLKRRVDLINHIKPNIFLSIHLNTFPNENVKGGQVFYQNNENSKLLANYLQDELNYLSKKSKKPKLGDYYLLNKTTVTGVIVECGFLTNSEDLSNLVKEEYQEKMVKTISKGIFNYFKNNSAII